MNDAERKADILKRSEFEDKILDLIYKRDEFTTSDLQGCVAAIVINIRDAYTK